MVPLIENRMGYCQKGKPQLQYSSLTALLFFRSVFVLFCFPVVLSIFNRQCTAFTAIISVSLSILSPLVHLASLNNLAFNKITRKKKATPTTEWNEETWEKGEDEIYPKLNWTHWRTLNFYHCVIPAFVVVALFILNDILFGVSHTHTHTHSLITHGCVVRVCVDCSFARSCVHTSFHVADVSHLIRVVRWFLGVCVCVQRVFRWCFITIATFCSRF